MPDVPALPWRGPRGVAARLIWPMAAILVAMAGLVIIAVIFVSDAANDISVKRQQTQVAAGVRDGIDSRASQFASLSVSDAVWGASRTNNPRAALGHLIGRRAAEFFGFDVTFVFSQDLRVVGGAVGQTLITDPLTDNRADDVSPIAASLFAQMELRNAAGVHDLVAPKNLTAGQLLFSQGAAYVVAAAPVAPLTLAPDAKWLMAVGMKRLDDSVLASMAAGNDVEQLWVVAGAPAPGVSAIPIYDINGQAAAYLAWPPFRPGDLIREKLIVTALAALLGAIILSGMVFKQVQRVALDVTRSEEKARALMGHDPLSGLPNRMPFTRRLDEELGRIGRSGDSLALLFLDLDRFKDVNDTHGHAAGDELIKAVGRRLQDLLRGADTLARFGGDEFAIIQTGVKGPDDVEALARRVLNDLSRPFAIAGTQVQIGCSIGISLAPANGMSRDTLMRLADTALYQAKNEGRNRFSFFERQMDEALRLRTIVEDDLRDAITGDRLLLHYQPQVSADGLTVVGVEALVRWPHPTRGLISPAQFIPIAEERGLIIPLGEWVLRRACEDGRRWPGLRVAVNVSPIQFRHKGFVASVLRILDETGFDPTCLELELTEGVLVDDADAAESAMVELKALGIQLALDDFGTGYSSLIYLRRFAFDRIKIDRSFLESMEATGESAILVHSIVHLGRALGLTVTAEGVETAEQHRFLQAVGCHELQGYLFARPMPADAIEARRNAKPEPETRPIAKAAKAVSNAA